MDTSEENIIQEVVQQVEQVSIQVESEVKNEVATEVKNEVKNEVSTEVKNEQVVNQESQIELAIPQKISLIHYSSPTSLIYTVCGKVSHVIGKKKLTADKSKIMSIIHDVMGAIETVNMAKELKGKQKKDLAIDCLNWFVDQQEELSQEEKSFIHDTIKLLGSDAIDVMANIGNGISDLVKNGLGNTKMCCCTIV